MQGHEFRVAAIEGPSETTLRNFNFIGRVRFELHDSTTKKCTVRVRGRGRAREQFEKDGTRTLSYSQICETTCLFAFRLRETNTHLSINHFLGTAHVGNQRWGWEQMSIREFEHHAYRRSTGSSSTSAGGWWLGCC